MFGKVTGIWSASTGLPLREVATPGVYIKELAGQRSWRLHRARCSGGKPVVVVEVELSGTGLLFTGGFDMCDLETIK